MLSEVTFDIFLAYNFTKCAQLLYDSYITVMRGINTVGKYNHFNTLVFLLKVQYTVEIFDI